MRLKTLGLLILIVLLSFGCAGKTVDLKSSMVGIPDQYETKAALYFKSFQYESRLLYLKEETSMSKVYVQDIFSQIFSEVEVVSSLREIEKTKSSIIVTVEYDGIYAPYIRGKATVLVFDKNGQELFSGHNSSTTLNWIGSKKDFQDSMVDAFLPITKDLRQSPQVQSYLKSKKASHYAKQFAESSRIEPPDTTSPPALPQSGTGSGFFVSKMGHVITNAHVVKGCKKLTVGDNANKQVPAEVINTDRSNDLALLKLSSLEMASAESKSLIQKLSIVVVPLASKGLLRSDDVRLGEKVLVAG